MRKWAYYLRTAPGFTHRHLDFPYERRPDSNYGSLVSLMPYRRPPPVELLTGADSASLEILAAQVKARSLAVGYYLEAEIAQAQTGGERTLTPALLEKYLEAYRADADFAPARGQLMEAATRNPDFARLIYPHLNSRDKARIDAQLGRVEFPGDRHE